MDFGSKIAGSFGPRPVKRKRTDRRAINHPPSLVNSYTKLLQNTQSVIVQAGENLGGSVLVSNMKGSG
jgi:hypothetical protein